MNQHLNAEDKLEILRAADVHPKWDSLGDRRVCVSCGRVITGRQVDVVGDGRGRYLLQCPTHDCNGTIENWFPGASSGARRGGSGRRADGIFRFLALNRLKLRWG